MEVPLLQAGMFGTPAWQTLAMRQLLAPRALPFNLALGLSPLMSPPPLMQLLMGRILQDGNSFNSIPDLPVNNSPPPVTSSTDSGKKLNIVVIDQFQADNSGFNHGSAIANEIRNSDPELKDRIAISEYNVAGGNTTDKIGDALEAVLNRVKNGEQVDAVNLSQQDFSNNGDTQRVRSLIRQLSDAGVPVAVAAGNNGPNAVNQLADDSGFTVESATNGQVNSSSGQGNIRANARTTSFATARLTAKLAQRHADGESIGNIKADVNQSGGLLNT